ncbi:MAG: hypothetical protein ACJ06V_01710, partial [Verrucomicrobiota bacterium]
MSNDSKTRVRKLRWLLRMFVVLLLVLAGTALYLNQAGLPDFAKRHLQSRLAQREVQLDFDWLRMDWDGAWRVGQLQLGQSDTAGSVALTVGNSVIRPDYGALLSGRAAVRGLSLTGFQFDAQLNDAGANLTPMKVSFPEGELHLADTGALTAKQLKGDVLGFSVDVDVSLVNVMTLRTDRKSDAKPLSEKLRPFKARLVDLAKRRDVVSFRSKPRLQLQLGGDAMRLGKLKGRGVLIAGGATMPEGSLEDLAMELNLGGPDGIAGSLRVIGLATPTAKIGSATATVTAPQSISNAVPARIDFELALGQVTAAKTAIESVELSGSLAGAESPPETVEGWAYWSKLAPYVADFRGLVSGITGEKGLAIREVSLAGVWQAPRLSLSQLDAKLYDGGVSGSAELNVATRLATASSRVNFSLHNVSDLLTPKAQRWLNQYQWSEAPVVTGTVRARLPKWTNAKPDWRAEVRPTMSVKAQVTSGPMSFRGVEIESVRSDLVYSNLTLRLPNLLARRPEGEVQVALRSHSETRDFHFDFRSSIDPHAITPALEEEKQKKGFDYFSFETPPVIEGQVWGRWRERERTGFRASVAATNFTFRAQEVNGFAAGVSFANRFLSMTNAVVRRPEGEATLDALGFDMGTKRLYLTNAVGRLEPAAVAKAIGPKTASSLEAYQFLEPPLVSVNGWVQTGPGRNPAELHFEIDGGAFRFSRFNSQDIDGEIFWSGKTVTLTNIVAEFYGGELRGNLLSRF